MTIINFFGFDIPLEWFIPIAIWILIGTFAVFKLATQKNKHEIKTYVVEYDKTGLCTDAIKLDPKQEELTRIKYTLHGKEREVKKYQPLTLPNRRTRTFERLFPVPKDSDEAFNPESSFSDAMKTKSPSRMMQEFAVWLGNIRGMLSPGFSVKKNLFLLVAWGGFCLMMGVFIADYILPQLARNYH